MLIILTISTFIVISLMIVFSIISKPEPHKTLIYDIDNNGNAIYR